MAQAGPARAPQAGLHTRETPELTAQDGLETWFAQLREHDGITLPYRATDSPSKRPKSPGHDAAKYIGQLYYQQRFEALERALEKFRLISPPRCNHDDKLNNLLESLMLEANSPRTTPRSPRRQWQAAPSVPGSNHDHVKITSMGPPIALPKARQNPGSATSHWPPSSLQSTQLQDHVEPPDSPTLSIRRAPKPSLDDIALYPNLPPPVRNASPVTVVYAPLAMAPPQFIPSRTTSGTISANTSFTATSMNTSFSSDAQFDRDPDTPATSPSSTPFMDGIDESQKSYLTQQSNYLDNSSPPASWCHRVDRSAAPTSTEQTKFGTSIPDEALHDETPCKRRKLDDVPADANQVASSKNVTPEDDQTNDGPTTPQQAAPTETVEPTRQQPRTDSPGKGKHEHIRVKEIPLHGLACGLFVEGPLSSLPFELKWECGRLMQATDMTADALASSWSGIRNFTSLEKVAKILVPEHHFKSEADYKNCSFHAKLRWRDAKDKDKPLSAKDKALPLLRIELLAPSYENHNSWQRKYGSSRFLFLEVDNLDKPPPKLGSSNDQKEHILTRFLEMLGQEQELLGRNWLQFHAQQKKSNKKSLNPDDARTGIMQFTFAAVGSKYEVLTPPLTLRDIVGWSIPFTWNMHQTWCKAASRLDLYASRPTPIVSIPFENVAYIDDEYATEDCPDERFNDPRFGSEHAENEVYKKDTVMTDGCSEARPWLFHQIKSKFGLHHIPSAVQFRFAGAKGMISIKRMTSSLPFDPNVRPEGPLVWIRKSQLKVEPGEDNKDGAQCDEDYWMFQVLKYSHPTQRSSLYMDFLPILLDRGVPSRVIEEIAMQSAKEIKEEFLQCLEEPPKLREWIRRANSAAEDLRRANDMRMLAGFPKARLERAIRMLESGFEPLRFKPLAKDVQGAARALFERKKKTFKITLDNSTNLLGIADPTGTLAPGEIFYQASEPFTDPTTGLQTTCLQEEVLVSRSPAGRPSDIQEVRAVKTLELDHLFDVVVFSSKGPRPLADHLGGGDYDGDVFWVCWDHRLVAPFKNAPAPQKLPSCEEYGIHVDKRLLGEIIVDPKSDDGIRKFVRMATKNRMRFNLLGTVTKTLARVVHLDGLHSDRAKALMHLKDLIMDSDKNGRFFSASAWSEFKKKYGCSKLPTPAHFKYTNPASEDKEDSTDYEPVDHNNILDKIYFKVLSTTLNAALEEADKVLSDAQPLDDDLTKYYDDLLKKAEKKESFKREVDHLKDKLQQAQDHWTRAMSSRAKNCKTFAERTEAWDAAVIACWEMVHAIKPVGYVSEDTIDEWLEQTGHEPTKWDKIKASAMAKILTRNDKKMWFQVAACELCFIKASANPGSVLLTKQAYMGLKPKELKITLVQDDDVESDYGDIEDEDLLGADMEVGAGAGAEDTR